eukprot:gene5462-7563_t
MEHRVSEVLHKKFSSSLKKKTLSSSSQVYPSGNPKNESYKKKDFVLASEVSLTRFVTKLGNKHKDSITSICICNSGESWYAVTAGRDLFVNVWNLLSGEHIITLVGRMDGKDFNEPLTSICTYKDNVPGGGNEIYIIASGKTENIYVWKLMSAIRYENYELYRRIDYKNHPSTKESKGINCLFVYEYPSYYERRHRALLLTGDVNCKCYAWSILEDFSFFTVIEAEKNTSGHTDQVLSVTVYTPPRIDDADQFSPVVVTASWDKTVIFWNLDNGKLLELYEPEYRPLNPRRNKLIGHTKSVECAVVFEPVDSSCPLVITTSLDKSAIIWDYKTAEKIRVITGHDEKVTKCIAVNGEDGNNPWLITSSEDNTAIVWDILTGDKVRQLNGHAGKVSALACCKCEDGYLVVTGGDDKDAIIWNLRSDDRIKKVYDKSLDGAGVVSLTVFTRKQFSAVDPINLSLPSIAVTYINNKVAVFDPTPKGEYKWRLHLTGHTGRINTAVAYRWEERKDTETLLITGSADKKIIIWDITSGKIMKTLLGQGISIMSLAITDPIEASGSPLLISGSIDQSTWIWSLSDIFSTDNIECRTPMRMLGGHTAMVRSIAVYNPYFPGAKKEDLPAPPAVVTVSYDRRGILWDLKTGDVIRVFEGQHTANIFAVGVFDPSKAPASKRKTAIRDPLVITGGYDSLTIIWNMFTGEVIRKLQGHLDSITALSIYSPFDEECPPLLITGSVDTTLILWNLETGTQVEKLIGHTERIQLIAVFAPNKETNPLVFSGSDDASVIVWQDTLYAQRFMPLKNSIMRAFEYDAKQDILMSQASAGTEEGKEIGWPLLTDLYFTYGTGLFIENPELFMMAVAKGRYDFLSLFQPLLMYVLRFTNKPLPVNDGPSSPHSSKFRRTDSVKVQPQRGILTSIKSALSRSVLSDMDYKYIEQEVPSLLQQAIKSTASAAQSVGIVVDCWIRNLNTDIDDYLTRRLYHPSYYFHKKDLLVLAEKYPAEFSRLIRSLQLVRSRYTSDEEEQSPMFLRIHNTNRLLIRDCNDKAALNIWSEEKELSLLQDSKSDGRAQPVTALYLPLKDAAHPEVFSLFVQVSKELNTVDMFDSDVVKTALNFVWLKYGLDSHTLSTVIHLLYLLLFGFTIYSNDGRNSTSLSFAIINNRDYFQLGLQCLVLLSVLYFTIEELRQMHANEKMVVINKKKYKFFVRIFIRIYKHLTEFWSIVDVCIILTAAVGMIQRLAYPSSEWAIGKCILAVSSILVWFKILYFMRPFESSGPLVSIILQISNDIKFIVLVLAIVLAGFAQAFWLLTAPNSNPEALFGTITQSFLNCFLYMLGQNISVDFTDYTVSPQFSTLLLVVFVVFMMILMLNMLIAQMGDSYSKVRSLGLAQWRMEQAQIMLDQRFNLREERILAKPFLHVLSYSTNLPPNNIINNMKIFKDDIIKHTTFLQNKMNTYSVNDIAYIMMKQIKDTNEHQQSQLPLLLQDKFSKFAQDSLDQKFNTLERLVKITNRKKSDRKNIDELKSQQDIQSLELKFTNAIATLKEFSKTRNIIMESKVNHNMEQMKLNVNQRMDNLEGVVNQRINTLEEKLNILIDNLINK